MNLPDSSLLNDARRALKKAYGDRLAKIILYGSYARGEQTPESDIDLLVVLKDEPLDRRKERHAIHESIYPLELQYNISISARPISENRLATERSFFLNRVRKEGKAL